MNTPLNTPNGTIVKIVSFSLSQRILVPVATILTGPDVIAPCSKSGDIPEKSVSRF